MQSTALVRASVCGVLLGITTSLPGRRGFRNTLGDEVANHPNHDQVRNGHTQQYWTRHRRFQLWVEQAQDDHTD